MSLQWTIIACFLYAEIAIVLFLALPIASPKMWQLVFKSKFCQYVRNHAQNYFIVLQIILTLFLLEAIREIKKYSGSDYFGNKQNYDSLQGSSRLFRAQRNFYIAGFSLFLSIVIRRLVLLISEQATLLARSEASLRQAQSATNTARSLMNNQDAGDVEQNENNEAREKLVTDLKRSLAHKIQEINMLNEKLDSEIKNTDAMKSQSQGLVLEYDRLLEEFVALQRSMAVGGSVSGNAKKDD